MNFSLQVMGFIKFMRLIYVFNDAMNRIIKNLIIAKEPKTIQTKDERANLVYALKIKVKNDGLLKIGMYGEVQLNKEL